MPFVIADRVRETSTSTGTGSFTLGGALTGFRSFGSVLATADTTYYAIVASGGTDWEVGIGTFTAPNTLARTTVLSSSNLGSAVNFGAGAKDVFISLPASRTITASNGQLFWDNTNNRLGVGTTTPSTTLEVNGIIRDSKGDVRDLPINNQTTGYTPVISDSGKIIRITTGGVTIPSGVFSSGQAFSIMNNSTSNQSITQGAGVTLRLAGTATTGNRTLAQYGICAVTCVVTNEFVISGPGLS